MLGYTDFRVQVRVSNWVFEVTNYTALLQSLLQGMLNHQRVLQQARVSIFVGCLSGFGAAPKPDPTARRCCRARWRACTKPVACCSRWQTLDSELSGHMGFVQGFVDVALLLLSLLRGVWFSKGACCKLLQQC